LGTAYAYSDERKKAIEDYKLARDLALEAENPFLATAAIELLAGMQIYHLGQLRGAQQHLEQVLAWGKTQDGTYQAFTGTAHILLGAISLERNELDAAAKYLEDGIELIQQSGIAYSLAYTYCTKARLHMAQNEVEKAVDALRQADQAAEATPLMHILLHNWACQAKLALKLGDTDSASRWIERDTDVPGNLPPYLLEVQQISVAWVCLAQGSFEKALATTDSVIDQAEIAGRTAHVIESCLLKSLVFQAKKETTQAVAALRKAISFAASEGYIRVFLEGGKPVWELLPLVAGQNFNHHYVSQLLAAFDEKTSIFKPQLQPDIQVLPRNALAEPLTARECEVLKLIAAGYTNQQIADTLIVSLNTVKKHTTHIYGKLQVQNRTEASNRARELGLL
jgi:LuxR family maltose regulon positive regulatory protein